jgi:hypothetical protein
MRVLNIGHLASVLPRNATQFVPKYLKKKSEPGWPGNVLANIGAIESATQAPNDSSNKYSAIRLSNVSKHHTGLSRNITKSRGDEPRLFVSKVVKAFRFNICFHAYCVGGKGTHLQVAGSSL